jgi:hypothetical protein
MRKLTLSGLLSLILTAFTAFSTGGCEGLGATADDSGLRYGTFTPGVQTLREWSMFTTAERHGCKVPMILYATAGTTVTPAQADFTRRAFERAVSAWTNALAENNRNWLCGQATRVEWTTNAGTPVAGRIEVYIDAQTIRSYAIVGANQIYLAPQYTSDREPYAERVILHEMGHMVGLSDTYTEPGYQQPIGQPAGIMNMLYAVSWLTADDIAGANALYDFINGRGQFCSGDYAVGGAYENKNAVAFCVPRAGAFP